MFEFSPEVAALLTFLLTNGIKALFGLFGVEVAGKWAAVVAALVGAVLFFGQGIVGGLEPGVREIVVQVLNALVVILGAFGVHYSIKSAAEAFAG